jgi:predicted MFS family arabinose efflux permease
VAISIGGYAWAFGINTLSFFAVIAVVSSLTLPPPHHTGEPSILASIRAGTRYVAADPGLRVVVGYMALNTLLAAPFIALVPAVALKVFDNEDLGTAVLITAQGLGAVLMGLSLGWLFAHFGGRKVLTTVLFGLPVALIAYALSPTLGIAAVAIFVVGFLYLGALSSFTTTAQLRAPAALRGRVMSVLMVLLGSLYPIGSIVQGAIADRIGLRATTVAAAVLMAAVLVVAQIVRPQLTHALDSEPVPVPPAPGTAPGFADEVHAP